MNVLGLDIQTKQAINLLETVISHSLLIFV